MTYSSYHSNLKFSTRGENDIVDITRFVQEVISKSKLIDGIINIVVPGATGAITTIEHEPGLLMDFPEFMEKIAPKRKEYHHNKRNFDDNGHSHLRASLIGSSLTLNFKNNQLVVGTWQQVVFIEFDTRSRNRHLDLMLIGLKND
ncbi:MAG: secondary thiamine-phosphate synthase enzyme YjbQ [Candidatus Hodarchaeales archaeon]|jgi:secondary thiamine-phosphate synthase enzyme